MTDESPEASLPSDDPDASDAPGDSDPSASADRLPYRVEVTDRAADLQATYAELEDGGSTGTTVTVAGRIMLLRDMGRLAFATLRDSRLGMRSATVDNEAFRFGSAVGMGLPIGIAP